LATTSVISVVDNDASVRASINNFLRSLGYVVHTFWSAEEFLGSPQLNDTSCVITDIQMSAMDGFELLRTRREETRGALRCRNDHSLPGRSLSRLNP